MSILWILPVVVVAAGMVVIAVAAREAARAAADLGDGIRSLGELGDHAALLRVEATALRDGARSLRRAPGPAAGHR